MTYTPLLPAGAGGTGLTSPGASGNVLTSDGVGAWTSGAPTGGPPTGAAGPTYLSGTYPDPDVVGLGQNVLWLVEGGKYATLQAAFNAASEGDTIVVGPKATGTWGDLVITENKTMSYVGLNGVNGKQVEIGAITFSPATGGLNINRNEHFFSNLMITGSFASQAVLFSGTGAGRMRFAGCFINNTSLTGDGIVNSNTFNTGTTSSLWLDNTTVLVNTTSGAAIRQSGQYTFVKNRCDISGGASAVVLTAGTFECVGASIEMNGTGSVISVSATLPTVASCLLGYSTVKNTTTNGSGVTLTGNGAALSAGIASFIVATGTGYCVRGTGTFLYAQNIFSNSAAAAYNVKVQNTVTALPVTTTFTSAP